MKTNKIITLTALALVTAGSTYLFHSNNSDKPKPKVAHAQEKAAPVSTPEMAVLPASALTAAPSQPKVASTLETQKKTETELDVLEQPDDNPNFETFNDRYQDIVARRPGMQFDPNELYEAMQKPDAWETTDEAPSSFDLEDKYKDDGRVFISFSPMKLETMARGDKLKISIAEEDIDFTAVIDDVRSDNGGSSVTWSGTSDDPNSNDKITITRGDTLVVGGIFTDKGLYQLEVKDGQGYIVSNATLFRHGQDQQVVVPQDLIDNPPDEYVELEAETFGG